MNRRWAVLLAIVAGCEQPAGDAPAPLAWVYPPPPAPLPLPAPRATIGRSHAPQAVLRTGISGPGGSVIGPLVQPTPWPVPGDGAARAVVYGTLAGAHVVELIDIDAGRVVWRETTSCGAPVVGVTADAVVCSDGASVRAISLADGILRWKQDASFGAMTDGRVALLRDGHVVVFDASDGDELARITLPDPTLVDSIHATCGDAGRELFAYGRNRELVRIAEGRGGSRVTWHVPVDDVKSLDACEGTTVLAWTGTSLVALSRETGQITGRVDDVRASWPARDGKGGVEVATSTGIVRWSRDLSGIGVPLEPIAVHKHIATRGPLVLASTSSRAAVLLDERGVRAYLPFAVLGAALGDNALIGGHWLDSGGHTVLRMPYPERYRRELRVAAYPPAAAYVPAELRDLPVETAAPLDASIATQPRDPGAVAGLAVDTREPGIAYALTAHDSYGVGVARLSASTRAWSWRTTLAGKRPSFALALGFVVVGLHDQQGARVVALSRASGAQTWELPVRHVDRITAARTIALVFDAAAVHVIDIQGGRVIGALASRDGAPLPADVVDVNDMEIVVAVEGDRIVGRLPRAQMLAAWSVRVLGTVTRIDAVGDGVVATLEDGDAYRLDARTGDAVALAGVGAAWSVTGDSVALAMRGGPIAPAGFGDVPMPPREDAPQASASDDDDDVPRPPRLPTPKPMPEHMAPSWQLSLFDATGRLRSRNDYPVSVSSTPAVTRVPGAPIVVEAPDGMLLVLDPVTGDPLRRIRIPDDLQGGEPFSTVSDGKPIVGIVVPNPLRAVLF